MQVFVRDNNVDQALHVLKKKMQREGLFRELKRRRFYEKPSDKITREKSEAIRRRRKLARKQAVRDGLIAAPAKKRIEGGRHRLAGRACSMSESDMRIYIFRSEAKSELRAFARDAAESKLPDRFGPWRVVGVVRSENEATP